MTLSITQQLLLRAATEEADLWEAALEVADILPSASESEVRREVASAVRSLIDLGLVELAKQPLRGGLDAGEASPLSAEELWVLADTNEFWAKDAAFRLADSYQVVLRPTSKGVEVAQTALTDL